MTTQNQLDKKKQKSHVILSVRWSHRGAQLVVRVRTRGPHAMGSKRMQLVESTAGPPSVLTVLSVVRWHRKSSTYVLVSLYCCGLIWLAYIYMRVYVLLSHTCKWCENIECCIDQCTYVPIYFCVWFDFILFDWFEFECMSDLLVYSYIRTAVALILLDPDKRTWCYSYILIAVT